MRSLGGLVLLAGIGVGLFVYLPAPVDSGTSLDKCPPCCSLRAAESTRSIIRLRAAGTADVLTRDFPDGACATERAVGDAPASSGGWRYHERLVRRRSPARSSRRTRRAAIA